MSRYYRQQYQRREFSGRLYPHRASVFDQVFRGVSLFKSFWVYHCGGLLAVFSLNQYLLTRMDPQAAYVVWGAGTVLVLYAFLTAVGVWRQASRSDHFFSAQFAKAFSFVITMVVIYDQLMHAYQQYRESFPQLG